MAADFTLPGGTRPKSVTTNSLTPPIVIAEALDAGNYRKDTMVRYDDLTPAPTTFNIAACTVTSGSAIVTKSNAFANVRPGDGVSGTGIAGGSTVASKQSDSQITLSANATSSGTPTLTFTPPVYDANLFYERKEFSMEGNVLKMRFRVWATTGLEGYDSNADGADNTTFTAYGDAVIDQTIRINMDTWLGNQRVAKSA